MTCCKMYSAKFTELNLKSVVERYGFNDLMEYTLDSCIGCRLDLLYKEIFESHLNTRIDVFGKEISDGKYMMEFVIEDKSYFMVSKARYTVDDVVESIISCAIHPLSHYKGL